MQNQSLWTATHRMPGYSALKENMQTDVCVVGGGIAGLTTAYLLGQEGKKVIVIDDGELAGGMTQFTTGHLVSAIDDRIFHIEHLHGEANTRLAVQSHAAAIDQIEAIVKKENIDCDFFRVNGYLFLPAGEPEEILDRELAAAHRAGFIAVRKLPSPPLTLFDAGPCLEFPEQGQFHPLKYLAALAKAIIRDGGRIFTSTHVDTITGGVPAKLTIGNHVVIAEQVVVATNSPVNDRFAIHTKQSPYMSYVIAGKIPQGSVPRALYWDAQECYHYIRLQKFDDNFDLLIVGGEDHRTGQEHDTHAHRTRLEEWTRKHFPMVTSFEYGWSGQVMETVDGLGFIGHNPLDKDNVYVITGDSGMGMTHGTLGGMIVTDQIMDRKNPWAALYAPNRKTLRATGRYLQGTANALAQYTDWLSSADATEMNQIAPDSGALLRHGLGKVAVYRAASGELHKCSATCPHLGAIVQWNESDKTWDCPMHGSRFDKFGTVINGPANCDLGSVSDTEETQANVALLAPPASLGPDRSL